MLLTLTEFATWFTSLLPLISCLEQLESPGSSGSFNTIAGLFWSYAHWQLPSERTAWRKLENSANLNREGCTLCRRCRTKYRRSAW